MIRVETQPGQADALVTFGLPADVAVGQAVAVVGDFNGWNPYAHPFEPVEDGIGARQVSVLIPAGRYGFRYLSEDGSWFDDDDASDVEGNGAGGQNSVLDLSDLQTPDGSLAEQGLPGVDEPIEPGQQRG